MRRCGSIDKSALSVQYLIFCEEKVVLWWVCAISIEKLIQSQAVPSEMSYRENEWSRMYKLAMAEYLWFLGFLLHHSEV